MLLCSSRKRKAIKREGVAVSVRACGIHPYVGGGSSSCHMLVASWGFTCVRQDRVWRGEGARLNTAIASTAAVTMYSTHTMLYYIAAGTLTLVGCMHARHGRRAWS